MVQVTEYLYVFRDDEILNGEPIIRGTRTPVRAIVESWRMGIAREEIPKGMPYLTLGQVHCYVLVRIYFVVASISILYAR